ncbi:hypothetical protein CFter6_2431 [Collimonas fungivorans]|uniref:DUF4019 domain-containing protein n=1 Tax=Collimonas fungivorans TaxID=158899 RepID=A0A127PBH5_9BURK|nr:DUF4019 domain-containing protein [Collimonas fungivorans]AMO95103.1 hypothetical protein CFter6_2431 [Collimonas fungivorans]
MTTLLSLKKISCATGFAVAGLLAANPAFAQGTASIDGAIATASQWIALADSNQAERMWSSSGPAMQKSTSKEDWMKYLSAVKTELGPLNSRQWEQIVHVTNPPELPPGEYLNIAFSGRFAKAPTLEKVSMVQAGDKWIPVGYVITKFEPAPAAAADPAAPKK